MIIKVMWVSVLCFSIYGMLCAAISTANPIEFAALLVAISVIVNMMAKEIDGMIGRFVNVKNTLQK